MIVNLDEKVTMNGKGNFFADASDLGLAVGKFPTLIHLKHNGYMETYHFVKEHGDEDNGLVKVEYKSSIIGSKFFIYND